MNATRTKARSKEKIRLIAEKLLSEFSVARAPVPVEKIATSLGATVRYSPFEGELAGILVRGEDRVVIGVNSSHHSNRQRFTIAHECGHLVLHEGETYVDKAFRVNLRDDVSSMAIDPQEIEANRFAAELLMPYRMLVEDLQGQEIDLENEEALRPLAKKYGVSVQAMTHRVAHIMESWLNQRRR